MITYAAAGGGGGKRGTGRLPERSRDAFAFFNASDDDEKSEGVEKKRKTRAGDISPASHSRRTDNPAHKNLIKVCTRDSVMRGPPAQTRYSNPFARNILPSSPSK